MMPIILKMPIMPKILIINFAKDASHTGKTLAKCVPLKVTQLSFRKISEEFGRGLKGFLMRKGYEKGGVSL